METVDAPPPEPKPTIDREGGSSSEPPPGALSANSISPGAVWPQGMPATSADLGDEIPFESLDRRWVELDRLTWWIVNGVYCVGSILSWSVVNVFARGQLDFWAWLALIGLAVVFMLLVWCANRFPEMGFRTTKWRIVAYGVEIWRGIYWRHRIFIPRDRIQHTDVTQGPLQRKYGLATLVINTGGTHDPSISLEGLRLEVAEAIRNQLSIPGDKSKQTAIDMAPTGVFPIQAS